MQQIKLITPTLLEKKSNCQYAQTILSMYSWPKTKLNTSKRIVISVLTSLYQNNMPVFLLAKDDVIRCYMDDPNWKYKRTEKNVTDFDSNWYGDFLKYARYSCHFDRIDDLSGSRFASSSESKSVHWMAAVDAKSFLYKHMLAEYSQEQLIEMVKEGVRLSQKQFPVELDNQDDYVSLAMMQLKEQEGTVDQSDIEVRMYHINNVDLGDILSGDKFGDAK